MCFCYFSQIFASRWLDAAALKTSRVQARHERTKEAFVVVAGSHALYKTPTQGTDHGYGDPTFATRSIMDNMPRLSWRGTHCTSWFLCKAMQCHRLGCYLTDFDIWATSWVRSVQECSNHAAQIGPNRTGTGVVHVGTIAAASQERLNKQRVSI